MGNGIWVSYLKKTSNNCVLIHNALLPETQSPKNRNCGLAAVSKTFLLSKQKKQ